MSSHFLSSHLDIEFRVKNHKKNKLQKKQNGGENEDGRYNKFS
jgi:hypothetical protein